MCKSFEWIDLFPGENVSNWIDGQDFTLPSPLLSDGSAPVAAPCYTCSTANDSYHTNALQAESFSYQIKSQLHTIPDINTLNSSLLSPLSAVYSPWDQSGWRCERGRCRCSRSRLRGGLHRPSRTSRAKPTRGARMRVASAGAAAVAVPGRSSPAESPLAHWGSARPTLLHVRQHSLSYWASTAGPQLLSHALDRFACELWTSVLQQPRCIHESPNAPLTYIEALSVAKQTNLNQSKIRKG